MTKIVKPVVSREELTAILSAVRSMLPEGTAAYVAIFDPEITSGLVDVGSGTHDLPFHHSVVLRNLAKIAAKKGRERKAKQATAVAVAPVNAKNFLRLVPVEPSVMAGDDVPGTGR